MSISESCILDRIVISRMRVRASTPLPKPLSLSFIPWLETGRNLTTEIPPVLAVTRCSHPNHGRVGRIPQHTKPCPVKSAVHQTMPCQISGTPSKAGTLHRGRKLVARPYRCKPNQITNQGHAASSVGFHYCQLHTRAKPVLPTIDYQRNMNV
jgi:hypothetical protein